jgi:PIN domain nuclease of toxin-antitoxin system
MRMPAERTCYVLDSFALLAYLEQEAGYQEWLPVQS